MNDKSENVKKQSHGANGITSLDQMIQSLIERDYIVSAQTPYRIGDPGVDEKQFYFQFLIEFHDHEQWLLQHTTSLRDRIKQQQWDAANIKRLNAYVNKALVVVPDDLNDKERKLVDAYDNKIKSGRMISALDGVIPFEESFLLIERKATSIMESGKAHATLGLNFERKVVDALNNKPNFERWKNNSDIEVGYLYGLYKDILGALKVNHEKVLSINATSNIPKLPSGGSPKADVHVMIESDDGHQDYTFSCKRSSADKVSMHEYTADAFIKVLSPEDNDAELKELLVEFQNAGGERALGVEKSQRFERVLNTYLDKLSKWVIGGIGGEGDPKTQWASHIITVNENTNEYHIDTIDNYIKSYEKLGVKGQFGTPFQWTYPSGGKGKRIQLKGKLI